VSKVTSLTSFRFAKKKGGSQEFSLIGTVVVTVTRAVESVIFAGEILTSKFLTVAPFKSLSATIFPSEAVDPGAIIERAVS